MVSDAKKKAKEQKLAKLAKSKAKRDGKDVSSSEKEREENENEDDENENENDGLENESSSNNNANNEIDNESISNSNNKSNSNTNNNNNNNSEKGANAATAAMLALSMKEKSNGNEEISPRSVTGVLASHPKARDVHISQFSIQCYGKEIVMDADLTINFGRKYGLIGANASGKSTFMKALGAREVPIPEHIDIHLLNHEAPALPISALEFVTAELTAERARLEALVDSLAGDESDAAQEQLETLYERLDLLDADVAQTRAASILHGLGFSPVMQNKATKEFSGGWRMRIALAKALFLNPALLLLDEPTNHLDLEACVWLEDYVKKHINTLIVISHSQDFLNGVCTNIMHLFQKKLTYYTGNYDQYVKTRAELEENQAKKYEWEQAQIADMKEYIARFGHGSAKLARQAQSKEKTLKKMIDGGLTERVARERSFTFKFEECGTIPPPVLQFTNVSFGYPKSEKGILYSGLDFGVDLDSRIALVGPNGCGKSTLLKLMVNEINPIEGGVRRHPHLRIGRYHQHLADQLDMELNPIEFMQKQFPDQKEFQEWRTVVGKFGLSGNSQTSPIGNLSDGQKSRLAFAWITVCKPHLLLLDEPTNHLDIETIDALAAAINKFEGGMVLVSHDFRLIDQVAKEIWVVDKKEVKKWQGTIHSYKDELKKNMERESRGNSNHNNTGK